MVEVPGKPDYIKSFLEKSGFPGTDTRMRRGWMLENLFSGIAEEQTQHRQRRSVAGAPVFSL